MVVSQKKCDKRIRLLVVSHSLSGGGAERFTSTLLSSLDRSWFEPSICLIRDRISYPLPDDVSLTLLGKSRPWHLWRTINRLRRVVEQTRPHVVLSSIAFASRITGAALRGVKSVQPRWIARIGANPSLEENGWRYFISNVWNRHSYASVETFVTNSKGLALGFTSHYPFTAGRVYSIPNPTDFERIDKLAQEPSGLQIDPDIPIIISVGRLDKGKRPDVLLESFARVRRRMPVVLWICGDGPLRNQTARDIAARGLGDSVKLLGFQENPYALMRQATVFVMTSDHEGLPNALIEAQGLGIPAISTRCPYGPDEIIQDGKTGILADVGDSPAIAQAIEELLTNPVCRQEMAQAATKRARRMFDKSIQIKEWGKVLRGS